jgi:16S rRNA processing protein RimM
VLTHRSALCSAPRSRLGLDENLDAAGVTSPKYIEVAVVARPHGVKGELRLSLYQRGSDLLLKRPPVRLITPAGDVRAVAIRAARRVPEGVLVTFEGVADRDAAKALCGARVQVAREALPRLGEGEIYCVELVGCEVRVAGVRVGGVLKVVSYPTCDAVIVGVDTEPARAAGWGRASEVEVPLTDGYVAKLDGVARVVELVRLPEPGEVG